MTPSIREIQPFDVLIALVRFEDKPDVSKPRPVIVLNVNDGEVTILAVKVTSHAPREWCPGEVALLDWKKEGLAKPSVARCSKKLVLVPSDIKARCGTLTQGDRTAVLEGLASL